MNPHLLLGSTTLLFVLSACATKAPATEAPTAPPAFAPVHVPALPLAPPNTPVDAIVDLRTEAGVDAVGGTWRYADAQLVERDFRSPGPDKKATGPKNRTLEIEPKAGVAGFDDSKWSAVDPTTLEDRRGTGKVSFGWYRIDVTLPERVGDFDVSGSTVLFEIVVDDYSEIWVDGELSFELGQAGRGIAGGFNVPNRAVLTRDAKPGQTYEIAVFGINGPISAEPTNFIWVRSATLDFHANPTRTQPVSLGVDRRDPRIDAIVPAGTRAERVATGFEFVEGPVWVDGGLTFSDPNANTIYRLRDGGLSVFRAKSGYTGGDIGRYHQPGSNGLALDPQGRLSICEHGNRRVTRLEPNGTLTVLVDNHEGKRLNSPNDLIYRSDGTLYFTDPPFGLPKVFDDPAKELDHQGVYRYTAAGALTLESRELQAPNGLAFSPDEAFLYVDNWQEDRKVVMRYPVAEDGALGDPELFHDMTSTLGEIALDGLEVDAEGNVYVAGPGGIWVMADDGTHLGTLSLPELPANFAFGGDNGRDLYVTARTSVYRLPVGIPGATHGGTQ